MGEKQKIKKITINVFCILFSSTFNQMMMGSIGYIISGFIFTLMCACACKLSKKRGSKWIRKVMESDTEDTQSEGQVEEVSSSGGAVIEVQEFSHTGENTYVVPMPSSSIVMGSANPTTLDPYPDIPPKVWLPPILNIAPGSISRPTKEKKSIQIPRGVVGCCIRACKLKKKFKKSYIGMSRQLVLRKK